MTTYNTGNPLGSSAAKDLYDNAQNLDKAVNDRDNNIWIDRFGVSRRTWHGLELMVADAASMYGYIIISGKSFTTGATVNLNEALLNESTGEYYHWTGSFPDGGKIVPPNSSPESTGGEGVGKWLSIGDAATRTALKQIDGYSLIGSASYADIRNYAGTASVIYCSGISNVFDGGFGYFDLDPSDTSTADNGGTVLVDANGRRWKRRISDGVIHAEWFGLKQDWNGTTGTDNAPSINKAIAAMPVSRGCVVMPVGEYMISSRISLNRSNATFRGAGIRVTNIICNGLSQSAGIEVNNGSWDYSTNTYTYGGTSIGHTVIKDISFDGTKTTGSTGVVFSRATLGCKIENSTFENFSVGGRFYGSWYAIVDSCQFAGNAVNMYADYETNDFACIATKFVSNPANQTLRHVEFQGAGTCRSVSFVSCCFDGGVQHVGLYFKNVIGLSFSGETYAETYPSEMVKNAAFFQFGTGVKSVRFNGIKMTTAEGYSGTWIICGTATDVGVDGMEISGCIQYKNYTTTDLCTSINTQYGKNIGFGKANRFESPMIIPDVSAITSGSQSAFNIQSLSGTSELISPICIVNKPYSVPVLRIRVQFLAPTTLTGNQYLRVLRSDGSVLISALMTGGFAAGSVRNLTDDPANGSITNTGRAAVNSVLAKGEVLSLQVYKNGATADWPPINVLIDLP